MRPTLSPMRPNAAPTHCAATQIKAASTHCAATQPNAAAVFGTIAMSAALIWRAIS